MVLAAFVVLIGYDKAYGVFLDYFLAEGLYPNASPFDYALIGGLSVSMALIITPAINLSTRKLGTRPTLLIGLVLFTASLIGASFATEVWHLYLSQGVCIGWGAGFLYVGSANIIPQWFSRRRSLANGICASGAGFGGLIYSLATSALLQSAGPPLTFRVLAACQFVANLVSIILISDRNQTQRPNQSAFNYRLLKRGEVWLVLGWGCMSELGYTVLLFSLPNYARSIGLNAKQGSVVAALLNLSTFFGRILLGHSSDVLGRINITSITTGFCGTICLVIWIFAKSFAVLCFFAVLAGMVCGAFWATVAPVAADVTGLSELPSTLSIVLVLMVVPATCMSLNMVSAYESVCSGPKLTLMPAVAECIGLALKRSTGNTYLDTQIFVGLMFIGASICTLFLRSWKIARAREEVGVDGGRGIEPQTHVHQQSRASLRQPLSYSGRSKVVLRRLFTLEKV